MEVAIDYAESFLRSARKYLEDAERHLKDFNYAQSVSRSQECIEFAGKAIFLLLGEEYPRRHWFSDEELVKLMERAPEDLRQDLPKLFLRSKFWADVRNVAKYGDERIGLGPERLYDREEAELALKHAKDWYYAGSNLGGWVRVELAKKGKLI